MWLVKRRGCAYALYPRVSRHRKQKTAALTLLPLKKRIKHFLNRSCLAD
jgi:hypothetical protein